MVTRFPANALVVSHLLRPITGSPEGSSASPRATYLRLRRLRPLGPPAMFGTPSPSAVAKSI
jgi:hypothetical protein